MSKKVDSSNNVEFGTSAQLLPMQCYVQGGLELNKIHLGNCLDLIKQLPSQSIDVCLTDAPYGIGETYKSFDDTKENLGNLIYELMPELLRVCKRVAITCGVENMWYYPKPTWVLNWYCKAGAGSSKWGFTTWQPILVYGQDPYLTNGLGRRADTIEQIEIAEKNGHPCPKPITLWRKVLERVSVKESDIVLDPFMGSGTTAIACIKSKRQWIGFEIEQDYVNIANKRIANELSQPELF